MVNGAKFVVGRLFLGDFLATARQGYRVQSAASPALGRAEWQDPGDFISLAPRQQSSLARRVALARHGDGGRVGAARDQAARYSAGSGGLFNAASHCLETASGQLTCQCGTIHSGNRTSAICRALKNKRYDTTHAVIARSVFCDEAISYLTVGKNLDCFVVSLLSMNLTGIVTFNMSS